MAYGWGIVSDTKEGEGPSSEEESFIPTWSGGSLPRKVARGIQTE